MPSVQTASNHCAVRSIQCAGKVSKIRPFSKIFVTFKPMMQYWYSLRFKIPKNSAKESILWLEPPFWHRRKAVTHDGPLDEYLIKTVFVKLPLALDSPGSANKVGIVKCSVVAWSIQCALRSVQCSSCRVQSSVCSVKCADCGSLVCSVQCAVCSVQCTVCRFQCEECSMKYSVISVQCSVFRVHSPIFTWDC